MIKKAAGGNRYQTVILPLVSLIGRALARVAALAKMMTGPATALACALTLSWSAHAGSSYLAVWSSDKEKQDSRTNTDFLAIIDADPRSASYGKVVNTASLQRRPG